MDAKDTNMSDNAVDWNDPMFSSAQFDDAMPAESPFGAGSAFDHFTTGNDFMNSPSGLPIRTPSKPGVDYGAAAGVPDPQHAMHMMASTSLESSSQDSASDSSSREKRKNTSESPVSDPPVEGDGSGSGSGNVNVPKPGSLHGMADARRAAAANYQTHAKSSHTPTQPMQDHKHTFDFNSAASSPINPGAFDAALSLDEHVQGLAMPHVATRFNQSPPVQTINPATFTLGGSRDHSPSTNHMMFNNASPHSMFSPQNSDNNDAFAAAQPWTNNLTRNPAWPNDFNTAQFTSPATLQFTPSPTANGGVALSSASRDAAPRAGRSRLHIAPIATKSRVETQINVIMTLEKPPPAIEYLHLPLQTIAKSKLLAKDEVDDSRVLELHTMLVCTSAMRTPQLKQKALNRAAAQNNLEIQRRAEQQRDSADEDKNDPKNVPEDERPSNGGEVRICSNCIQRERKRAARKKLKKEEEQQHWERYETERVVVFNSNELLPFKPWEAPQTPQKETGQLPDDYVPPDGAMQVAAAMRIACYCRHQSEKEGFQVIFTMKDQDGNVVAQDMSDSILITDDHKTHPPSFSTHMSDQGLYGAPVYATPGLQTSYSMVDMSQHVQPGFTSSRSTGNLQSLAYGQQYNQQSHLHSLQNPGFASQTSSATMTPTNSLSRPASPSSAGHSGPNKKRKSSSFHRRVPSGLAMTPRVDTTVPPSAGMPASAMSMMSQFSPTTPGGGAFNPQAEQSYMTIPNSSGPAQFVNSGPPTPSENAHFALPQTSQSHARRDNAQQPIPDYYQSLPGSRVTSRAPSPVSAASRPNLAAYARQQMAPGNAPARNQGHPHGVPHSAPNDSENPSPPMIHKITPAEGPVSGGTEVSIYGRDFAQGMQVYFGNQPATAITFYGEQALLCTSPPGRVGGVQVTVVPAGNVPQYSPSQANRPVFTYKNANEKVMEMALRFVSQQQTGNPAAWWQITQQNATRWMQQQVSRTGFASGYEGGNMLASQPALLEDGVLAILDAVEVTDSPDQPNLDVASADGETFLTLACAAGLHRVVATLLARGTNPDGRDSNGFTPLMHAALHGKTSTFQLLLGRGADAAIRSLSGHTAVEVAPPEIRGHLQQILLTTPRMRSTRAPPSLHARTSTSSSASSRASSSSWDISSASPYESESDASRASSRRPSAHHCLAPMAEEAEQENGAGDGLRCPPSVSPADAALPPPAYSELFPEKSVRPGYGRVEDKKRNKQVEKGEGKIMGEGEGYGSVAVGCYDPAAPVANAKAAASTARAFESLAVSQALSWLWMPFVAVVTTAIMHAVATPYLSATTHAHVPQQGLATGLAAPALGVVV